MLAQISRESSVLPLSLMFSIRPPQSIAAKDAETISAPGVSKQEPQDLSPELPIERVNPTVLDSGGFWARVFSSDALHGSN